MFEEIVNDIMATDVVTINPVDCVSDALSIMAEREISFVVIASEENRPLGVITEKDVVRIIPDLNNKRVPVPDVMSSPVLTIGKEETAFAALHKLVIHNIRHLVVVTKKGEIAGALTLTNFLERLGFEYFVDIKDVSEVMSRDMTTLDIGSNVKDTITSMARSQASCAIIIDKGKPVGIFTERDAISVSCEDIDLQDTCIEEVMGQSVHKISQGAHVLDALSVMQREGIRHLPVMNNKDQLTGLISQFNITKGMELRYTDFLRKLIADQEKKLKEANAQLEAKVEERTRELDEKNEQLRRLALHLQEVREEERTGIARDIHDDLGQLLSAFKLDLLWIEKRLSKEQKPLSGKIEEMSGMIDDAIYSVQRITSELRPPLLDDLGITSVMQWHIEKFQKRSGIRCKLSFAPDEIILPEKISTAVFRIFQEALTNVARHADATKVYVSIKREKDQLLLSIDDNGRGITDRDISNPNSFGIIGMAERIHPWKGTLDIRCTGGKGTTVRATIPLNSDKSEKDVPC
jgi:signal transduction histidine kinase